MKIAGILTQKDGLKKLLKENVPALIAQLKDHLVNHQNKTDDPILPTDFVSVGISHVDELNVMIFLIMHQDDGTMRTGKTHNINDLIDELPSDLSKMLS